MLSTQSPKWWGEGEGGGFSLLMGGDDSVVSPYGLH